MEVVMLEPKQGCHAFCDALRRYGLNLGGQAHSSWYSLYYKRGVFIGYHNHDWGIWFLTVPTAHFTLGCQDSRAYGDPRPQPSAGEFESISAAPLEIQPKILGIAEEACQEVNVLITRYQEEKAEECAKKREQANAKQKEMIDAWRAH